MAAVIGALAGCSGPAAGTTQITFIPKSEIAQIAPAPAMPVTIVSVDDLLAVGFFKEYPTDEAAYRFDVGDTMELQFYTRTEPAQTYSVAPDGRIYLPEIGYLTVRGLTAGEIEQRIRQAYAGTPLAGPVNVVARITDAKVNELIETLGRGPNGVERTVRVLPDGTIALPVVDVVPVAGRTLAAVERDINARYDRLYHDLHVSISLQETNSRRYGVLGEVNAPGIFPLQNRVTLLEALSKAGGIKESGKASDLVIFRPNSEGVQVTKITQGSDEALTMSQLAAWYLEPSDVIYVPRTGIADLDLFVKQYITLILPFQPGFYYGFSTTFH